MELIVPDHILYDDEHMIYDTPPTKENMENAISRTLRDMIRKEVRNKDIHVSVKSVTTDPETIRERITHWEDLIQNKLNEQRRKALKSPTIKSIRDLIVAAKDAHHDWTLNSNYGILFYGMIADKDYLIEAPNPYVTVSVDDVIHEEIRRHPNRYILVACTMSKNKNK